MITVFVSIFVLNNALFITHRIIFPIESTTYIPMLFLSLVLNSLTDRIAFVVDKEVYIKNMYNNDKLEENSLGIFIGKNNLLLTRHGVTDMYSYIMN